MNITSSKYNPSISGNGNGDSIKATIDGVEMLVPLDPANRHYAAIMESVNAGVLTIEPLYTEQELNQMEAEAIAEEEAREAIRASALQKLVENAGLTVEEVKSFIKIEE
jgi:hypothetical protein